MIVAERLALWKTHLRYKRPMKAFSTKAALLSCAAALWAAVPLEAADNLSAKAAPVKIIFDTDIGNDVDDVQALAVLHAMQSRGQCELLGVTITKPDELAGPFANAANTFYGRPEIPIGFTRAGLTNDPSKFLGLVEIKDGGRFRYPHTLMRSSDAPPATRLLRTLLSRQPDESVVLVQVGFSSNLAALLDTPADELSALTGRDLVKQKVRLLSIMAGAFQSIGSNNHWLEYNVIKDLPAARKLAREWPTQIVWSGYEIGLAVTYPATSIERDFAYVEHHPVAEAYQLYCPPSHDHPTWDVTCALYAVLADRDYFGLSSAGRVTIEEEGFTRFTPAKEGRDRVLVLHESQVARIREALIQLTSQPPCYVLK